ncbi:DUF6339 family protein [Heyndrickxia sp. NPDC080065]|uniref:DUF6339 family protein n=1 Tax=Heyndrickxia sp. NPDC080065 TaxID=3390568 RepID=UPI003D06E05B
MKLNYMKEDMILLLRENMMNNIAHYQSVDNWVNDFLTPHANGGSWYMESRMSYQKANLVIPSGTSRDASKTDAENAKLIHKSLKTLSPAQAVDSRIWTYLTHNVYQEYMAARWLNHQNEISKGTLERYFASTNREIIRNGIARLWWYGYLTYDENRENPYELTSFLLSNQNIAQALLERNLGNNKEWLINMLDTILQYSKDYPSITHSENIKKLAKYINFSGGVTVLDCLSKESIKSFVLTWIKKNNLELEASELVVV